MELTEGQKTQQFYKQAMITGPVAIIGLVVGIIYAANTGRSKLGWGLAGWIVPAAAVAILLRVTDYGNPTK